MNPHLEAWLLEGTEPPTGIDLDTLLASDIDAQALSEELLRIDEAAFTLPEFAPPDALDAQILARIAHTPQTPAMPSSIEAPPSIARPANRWWRWAAAAAAVAAAALLVVAVLPNTPQTGDPANWTARGEFGAGPGVHMSLAVQDSAGDVQRFRRDDAYESGQTLLFRYDAHAAGWLHLVRVDTDGVQLIHTEHVRAGQGDLRTSEGLVGYELEDGESAAVFALIRHTRRLQAGDLQDALSVEVDEATVCAAVRSLGARCAAEVVEAVQ